MTSSIGAIAFCFIAWPTSTLVLAWHNYDLSLSPLGWFTLIAILLSAFVISYKLEKKFATQGESHEEN
jgi:hypothetical protein